MVLLAPPAPATDCRRSLRAVAAVAAGVALVAAGLGPAAAVNADLGQQVVSANPADFTPQIMDGSVKSIAQIGARIVAVGDFTTARQKGSTTDITRNGIVAFDATTGAPRRTTPSTRSSCAAAGSSSAASSPPSRASHAAVWP